MANAEQAEQANFGSFECIYCGETFSEENPCYNDDATYEDGSHRDGECKNCAGSRDAEIFNPGPQHEPAHETCESCGIVAADVRDRVNAYDEDVHNDPDSRHTVCDECDYQNRMDI